VQQVQDRDRALAVRLEGDAVQQQRHVTPAAVRCRARATRSSRYTRSAVPSVRRAAEHQFRPGPQLCVQRQQVDGGLNVPAVRDAGWARCWAVQGVPGHG
jgi:hypothetical protein